MPYGYIAQALLSGEAVPFFGSAASAVCRPRDAMWRPGKPLSWKLREPFLPFGAELAKTLAKDSGYGAGEAALVAALAELADAAAKAAPGIPVEDIATALQPVLEKHFGGPPELALVASFSSQVQGSRKILEQTLRSAFYVTPELGALHTKLAALESIQLYVTTNYDDLLERALQPRNPHVLVDQPDGRLIISNDTGVEEVTRTDGALRERLTNLKTGNPTAPILFKMHGSINRKEQQKDGYLITEGDYVDYLGRDGGAYIPIYIDSLMQGKNILFLGYSLEDWNVRVILSKLLKKIKPTDARCWAIVLGRSQEEQEIWRTDHLNIYTTDLLEFSDNLAAELDQRI